MPDIRKKIGSRIKDKRRTKKLTQEKLAEASGLSTHFISVIERGIGHASLETLQSIADSLDCDIRSFFDFDSSYLKEDDKVVSKLLGERIKKLDRDKKRLLLKITDYLLKG